MKILVRLPNWLGDVVMSSAFIAELQRINPAAQVDVIVKKGMEDVVDLFEGVHHIYPFSKPENGIFGFARNIAKLEKYDEYFALPNSFSSALMGFFSGAKKRIGYKNEMRSLLLTHSFSNPGNLHRAQEYVHLLEEFYNRRTGDFNLALKVPGANISDLVNDKTSEKIILNFNSEAQSRRMPVEKAVSITKAIRTKSNAEIIFTGSDKEKKFTNEIFRKSEITNAVNLTGKTTLKQLAAVISKCKTVVSTDSGIAHLSNALGVKTVVFFGAGNESNTAPFNKQYLEIIRAEHECECRLSNVCRYASPPCLTAVSEQIILEKIE